MSSIQQQVISGAVWVFGWRVADRLFYLLRLFVFAKFLTPHEFGLMGIVSSVMFIADVLTRTGVDTALIQRKDVHNFYDVGWTFSTLRGFAQTLVLIIIIYPIADFYDEPLLIPMLAVTALTCLFDGSKSIRVVDLSRQMQFAKLSFYMYFTSLISSVVGIVWAYIYQDVWALVSSYVFLYFLRFLASYYCAPYKPRFLIDKKRFMELWNFGKWIFLSGILFAGVFHLDNLLLGKLLDVTLLGYYTLAYTIARVIPTELVDNLRQLFFPAFSKLQDDIPRLRSAFYKTYLLTIGVGGALSAAMFALSFEFVSVFFDEKWMKIIPLLKCFSIWCFFQVLLTSVAPLLFSIGRPDLWAKLQGIRFVLLIALIFPLVSRFELMGAAYTTLASTLIVVPIAMVFIKKSIHCSYLDLIKPIFAVLIACSLVVIVTLFSSETMIDNIQIKFVAFGLLHSLLFFSTLFTTDRLFNLGMFDVFLTVYSSARKKIAGK